MDPQKLYQRYRELQDYVGWSDEDARRVQAAGSLLEPLLGALIEDFYAEIQRHPKASQVITGGQPQIDRLKAALVRWLRELFTGPYDQGYVVRRWRVGWRHVQIGLDQIFTNVALSRLRTGLVSALGKASNGSQEELVATIVSLNKLLDLDLAKIEDAYQTEYLDRFQRTERLAAIGQIAGGIAHELRNPLNVVKTSAYFLVNASNARPEKVADHLQRIERHVTVADNVVTALANFARMPVPSQLPFSVEQCVRDALDTNRLPGNVEVQLEFASSLPKAVGEAGQIGIVFANVIRNARDAMPDGGRLTIRGEPVDDGIEISFSDTGVGIAPENLARITEPLYSTKARGLGLGLALSRAILEKHGGQLRVTSEPNRGATFVVRLRVQDIAN